MTQPLQGEIHRRAVGIDADEQAVHGPIHGRECRADRDRLRTKGVTARDTGGYSPPSMGAVEYTNLRLSFKQRGDREYEVTAAIDDGPTDDIDVHDPDVRRGAARRDPRT